MPGRPAGFRPLAGTIDAGQPPGGSQSEINGPAEACESDQTLIRSLADGPSNNRGHHASSLPALRPLPPASDPLLPLQLQDDSVLPATGFLGPERRGRCLDPASKEAERSRVQANRQE
ncbi:uncharacterized protein METZ01_LOCUS243690 [marine metagenome]|uniref:Uncharacterized protein n=1 Tax=marine metagenome TaxID=408172 RepID=A0A382HTZ6_9ZZZZ